MDGEQPLQGLEAGKMAVRAWSLHLARSGMSSRVLMELVLHDLLMDLQLLHKTARNVRSKKRIEKYVERILEALDKND
jgi:hypothetical protein